jgi:hypothetical protein
MGVAVVMQSTEVPVEPGAESTVDVRIRNTGSIVDQFELDLVGDAATWAHVVPGSVNLMPGEESTAQIVFTPPRSSRVTEGLVSFALRVMSREDTDGSAVQESVVAIAPYSQVVGEILPRTSSGSRVGRHELALDNLGNHPELVTVSAADPDLKLKFRIEPVNVTIEPGTAVFVRIQARPRRRFLRGPNVTIPFTVTATPAGTEPVVLPAAMLQSSILPPWFLKALALLLAAALALVVLWFTVFKPAVRSTATEAAQEETAKLDKKVDDASAQAQQANDNTEAAQSAAAQAGDKAQDAAKKAKAAQQSANKAEKSSKTVQKVVKDGGGTTATLNPADALDQNIPAPTAAGSSKQIPFSQPKGVLWVSDLVLQNPNGDNGTVEIRRGTETLLTFGLQNFRDVDYHFIQPAQFTKKSPFTVFVNCTNVGTRCTPAVYLSGQVKPAPKPR